MKPIIKFTASILMIGAVAFASCKKPVSSVVTPPSPNNMCVPGNRPIINAQLVPCGTLSEPRAPISVGVGAAGNKILFAGGYNDFGVSSRVDIYDVVTQNWSIAELSKPRLRMAVATLGNKIFFAGGDDLNQPHPEDLYANVDIYDASTNTWSVAYLSKARTGIAAAAVGNKIFFAGGDNRDGVAFNTVDIYDTSTNSWSTSILSEARVFLSAVTTGDKIYFAGGRSGFPSSKIDIYDNASGSWSTSTLSVAKYGMACIAAGNKIHWAGGVTSNGGTGSVEIRDEGTQNISFDCLFRPYDYNATSSDYIGTYTGAGARENNIVFSNDGTTELPDSVFGYPKFDIYDITTNAWSIGVVPQNIVGASIISVNNTIYVVAGVYVNGAFSNQVWQLEF